MRKKSKIIDAFLCHNSADKAWVEALAAQIESETIDGRQTGRRLKVFFDKWDIAIGSHVLERINYGLNKARFIVLVLSKASLRAPWPKFEWSHAVSSDPTNSLGRIIPILRVEEDGKTPENLPAPFRSLNWLRMPPSGKAFRSAFVELTERIRERVPRRGRRKPPLATNALRLSSGSTYRVSDRNPATKVLRIRGNAPSMMRRIVGRENDVVAVTKLIKKSINNEAPGIVAIHGTAGVGKSAIIAALARHKPLGLMFPDGGLWAGVGANPDLLQSLRVWGRALRLPESEFLRIDDAVGALRRKLRNRRMILLVDDVWDEHHAKCFRVGDVGSVVLYTSRNLILVHDLVPALSQVYPLKGLSIEKGLSLLAEVAKDAVREFPGLCKQLVRDVDGLPLAIVVAGQMLVRETAVHGDPKKVLLSIRKDMRVLLDQPVPQDMVNLLEQTTPKVAAVLKRSIDTLNDQQRFYFSRLGVLPPSPDMFNSAVPARRWKIPRNEANRILRSFVEIGLLESPARGRYQIHPLMQALAVREQELRDG